MQRAGWILLFLCCGTTGLSAGDGGASIRYISDRTAVTLRADKGMASEVVAMIRSGTQVDLIEHHDASGYSRVRVGPGHEGWVLTRYLSEQPAAHERLVAAQAQLAALRTRNRELELDNRRLRAAAEQATPPTAPAMIVNADHASGPYTPQAAAASGYGLSGVLTGIGLLVTGLLLGLVLPLLPRTGRRRRWAPGL